MTTIARMVTELEADASGMKRGLDRASRYVEDFADRAKKLKDMELLSAYRLHQQGKDAADALLAGLERQFSVEAADAREELFRGMIDKAEFQRRGVESAQTFNRGILQGIQQLAQTGGLTRELHVRLVNDLKQAGLEAGAAFSVEMQRQAQGSANRIRGALGVVTTATTGATRSVRGFSRESVLAFVSVGYALEGLISGARRGDRALMQLARGGIALSGVFGPAGLVVGAASAAALAIASVFQRAKEEAENARVSFEETLTRMVNARDLVELRKQLRDIQFGLPDAGPGRGGGFADSLVDAITRMRELNAQVAELDERTAGLWRVFPTKEQEQLLDRQRETTAEAVKLQEAYDRVKDAIDRVTEAGPARHVGLAQEVVVAAEAALTFEERVDRTAKHAQTLLGFMEHTRKTGELIAGLGGALVDAYDAATAALERHGNKLDETHLKLLAIRDAIREALTVPEPILSQAGRFGTGRPFAAPTARPLPDQQLSATLSAIQRVGETSATAAAALITLRAGALRLGADLRDVGRVVLSEFTPFALIMRAIEPALRALQPAIDALVVPLTIVAQVVAAGLIPVFKLLFPIIRMLGIVLTILGEVIARIAAAISEVVGSVVRAIGRFISKIPGLGGFGRSVARAGEALLTYAAEQRQMAREFRDARRQLRDLTWESATDLVEEMGNAAASATEALLNVPTGFRVALARFNATAPVVTAPSTFAGSGGGVMILQFGDVNIGVGDSTPDEVYAKFLRAAREKSSATFGTSTRWTEL